MTPIAIHAETARGRELLAYIGRMARVESRSPSLKEIARHLDIYKSAAARLVDRLIAEGALERVNLLRVPIVPHPESPSTSY